MEIQFNKKLTEDMSLWNAPRSITGEELTPKKAEVKWVMHIDAREWGIQAITSYVTKVTLLAEDEDEETYDLTEAISTFEIQIEFSGEYDFHIGHLIEPEDLEIDFRNKSITVKFNLIECE
jgi:hypothetical protein